MREEDSSQNLCLRNFTKKFAHTYCGEAARRFWGYPLDIAQILEMHVARTSKQTTTRTKQSSNKDAQRAAI
jgi:hypothetical protein